MQRSKPDMVVSVTPPFPAESLHCRPLGRSKNFLFCLRLDYTPLVAGCAVLWSLEVYVFISSWLLCRIRVYETTFTINNSYYSMGFLCQTNYTAYVTLLVP